MKKITDFMDEFTIDPGRDIEPYFKKLKRLDIDADDHTGCFNCKDKINQRTLPAIPWTGVQYCWACRSLNVIHCQDRMSGVYTDVVYCYIEQEA